MTAALAASGCSDGFFPSGLDCESLEAAVVHAEDMLSRRAAEDRLQECLQQERAGSRGDQRERPRTEPEGGGEGGEEVG